ncbi:hypothetical protein NDS46_01500 [Paenibacillus thiaminolyticus]|uniref:hypothetical protein n=1 Tax=Paenibacillus thiaminolyticus TaxID=49283 RepID=UPI00232C0F5E|nr:hypothetical protein [Paenibacillus thiaminolyticus]WCF08624.1 hypothetical protein NDS46_01500 [Paenibacillus thiaminolyticus]
MDKLSTGTDNSANNDLFTIFLVRITNETSMNKVIYLKAGQLIKSLPKHGSNLSDDEMESLLELGKRA